MRLILLALASCLPVAGSTQHRLTAANWRNHPAVRAIRAITQQVEVAAQQGKLTVQTDSAQCNDGAVTLTAHLYTEDAPERVVSADEELTFPDILTGFAVKVERFFE